MKKRSIQDTNPKVFRNSKTSRTLQMCIPTAVAEKAGIKAGMQLVIDVVEKDQTVAVEKGTVIAKVYVRPKTFRTVS